MEIQQIRNATLIIRFARKKFVIDPWFSNKGADGWIGPTVDLPLPIEDIVSDVDAFFVTHIHLDHFNVYGMPKDKTIFVQNEEDRQTLTKLGFKNISILIENGSAIGNIEVYKTNGVHLDKNPELMGNVCGLILKHPSEKTVYIAGDTIWCPDVEKAIMEYQPDIIVVNGCAARIPTGGRLIMDEDDVYKVYQAAPESQIIVSHMEAVGHATVTRQDMRTYVEKKEIAEKVLIPNDGEIFSF